MKLSVVQTEALYEVRERVACLEFTDESLQQCSCQADDKEITYL